MKTKIVISIIFLFIASSLKAEILPEKTNLETKAKYLIFGGDIVFANLDFGYDVKTGFGYDTRKYSCSALLEYMRYSGKAILSDREYKTSIIHPHIKFGYKLSERFETFLLAGIGFGYFEVSDNWVIKKKETLTSFGFGIRYRRIMLIYRSFRPEVILTDEGLPNFPVDSHKIQISIGVVFDIKLDK